MTHQLRIETKNYSLAVQAEDLDEFVVALGAASQELSQLVGGFIVAAAEPLAEDPSYPGVVVTTTETNQEPSHVPDSVQTIPEPTPSVSAPEATPEPEAPQPPAKAAGKKRAAPTKVAEVAEAYRTPTGSVPLDPKAPDPVVQAIVDGNGSTTYDYADMVELMDRYVEKHPEGNIGARTLVKKHGYERLRLMPVDAYPALAAEVRSFLAGAK